MHTFLNHSSSLKRRYATKNKSHPQPTTRCIVAVSGQLYRLTRVNRYADWQGHSKQTYAVNNVCWKYCTSPPPGSFSMWASAWHHACGYIRRWSSRQSYASISGMQPYNIFRAFHRRFLRQCVYLKWEKHSSPTTVSYTLSGVVRCALSSP